MARADAWTAWRIAGVPASPNVGLRNTGVSGARNRGSVGPLTAGSSSVTTIGTRSSRASVVSQIARSSAGSEAKPGCASTTISTQSAWSVRGTGRPSGAA